MPKRFGRELSVLAVGLGLAVSCGRTAQTDGPELDANGGHAGAPVQAAGGRVPTAGSRNSAASGAAGAADDDAGPPEGGAPEPGILLFDGVATRVGVIGDREGNALVQWDAGGGLVRFARWHAAGQQWLYPEPVALDLAFLVDTQRSGHPLLIGNETDPDSGDQTTVVRRFDPQTNEWGPAQATGMSDSSVHLFHLSMDGKGNAYAFWLSEDRTGAMWTWWPVNSAGWMPLQAMSHVSRIVGAREEGAWLWQENSGFGVRAFDVDAGSWSDEYELEPLAPGRAARIYQLVVGPSGEALATAWHHEPTELVLDAWRYDPELAAWQPRETAVKAATDVPNGFPGPPLPITDFVHQDIVALPVPTGKTHSLLMNRRDPATGSWSPLHELAGIVTPDGVEFEDDDAGNLYGYGPAGLFHYSAATDHWLDTPVEGGSFELAVSGASAFVLGWKSGQELVAYSHPAGDGDWRSARGLPEGVIAEVGSVPFAIAPLGEDHAIVVWPTRIDSRHGSVRATFIE